MSDVSSPVNIEVIWKPVDSFPNYEVSNMGCIRNAITLRVLNPAKDRRVILCATRTRQRFSVTNLVAATFMPDIPVDAEIIFKDGDYCNWAIPNLEVAGEVKTCTTCHENRSDTVPFRHNQCMPCRERVRQEHLNSLSGFVVKLLNSSLSSASRRLSSGRVEAGQHSLTHEDIIEKYQEQDGKCFYSGIQMRTVCNSEWMMSLERVSCSSGYIPTNVALACVEFNSTFQWSLDLIMSIPSLINTEISEEFALQLAAALRPAQRLKKTLKLRTRSEDDMRQCCICKDWKDVTDFCKTPSSNCKSCHKKVRLAYADTFRGSLTVLCGGARHSTKTRQSRSKTPIPDACEVDVEFLIELLQRQRGRCAYSHIPLQYGYNKPWRVSLERVTNTVGYTRGNVVLVCVEFNVMENTSAADKFQGHSGWNRTKFQLFFQKKFGFAAPEKI